MGKPFTTCSKHGWTERVASGGPCKKCASEAVSPTQPIQGQLGNMTNIDIRITKYMPDNVMFVNPNTYTKFMHWIHDMQVRLNEKQKSV